jgi:integrase
MRGVFNSEELNKFEAFAMQTKHAWQKWSLLLAMYTGARRTEIYQLRKPDIRVEDAINYILVTDEHESQRLKTNNAKRKTQNVKFLSINV